MPLGHNDHLTLPEYCNYMEAYVHKFNLPKRCQNWKFETAVTQIRRARPEEDGNHIVQWEDLQTGEKQMGHFDALALCTGLHVEPNFPEIPGLPLPSKTGAKQQAKEDNAPAGQDKNQSKDDQLERASDLHFSEAQASIQTLHSSSFKDPSIFQGRKVMILGTGETGMDLGYLAVKNGAKEIVLCTRGGFLSFPAVLSDFVVLGVKFEGKLPIDGLISNLFETSHVAPWVAQSHLRWHVSDFVLRNVVLPALTGTKAGCSQWAGELPPERQGRAYVFLNKSAKAMPYINRPYKKRNRLAEAFAHYLDPPDYSPDETGIDLAPFPHHVKADGGVVFNRTGRKEDLRMRQRDFKPDICVYATGYTQSFPCLADGEYPLPRDADCRDIFCHHDPSVAFIGFTRPGVGAIPPQAEMSAQMWTMVLAGRLAPPTSAPHYHLLAAPTARIRYGVDYSSYVSQLARDQGADPGLWELYREHGLHVWLAYVLGAAFTPFYRLIGPWRSETAAEIAKTELWDTIKRRGIGGNLMMGIIPMVFYAWVNLAAYILQTLYEFVWVRNKGRSDDPVSSKVVDVRKRR